MADVKQLQQDAATFAKRAIECDENNITESAIFYYTEAAQALITAFGYDAKPEFNVKASEYLTRAEHLKHSQHAVTSFNESVKTETQKNMERAKFLVTEAFEADNCGNNDEAIENYMQAVEICLRIRKESTDETLKSKVAALANQALTRAEKLKGVTSFNENLSENLNNTNKSSVQGAGASYTKEEIKVLRDTSVINNNEYVPFMLIDLKEKFAYPLPFKDKVTLELSPKQKSRFSKWVRPDEYSPEPKMIFIVTPLSIRQTLISDCSFVASLAVSAQYERRFNKKLITSIIYPQKNGEPVYNPCGKYMIKLNLNGVLRKVIIDDYLPMSQHGELLCSYSSNNGELWVSLLEKAYMKVMGGYDFPGSNSNIDLHALTGWIPERLAIDDEFNVDKEYQRLLERFHNGDCLITLATGNIPELEADRAGLVPTHAYALLDIRIVKGNKLIQLKNPWSHLRWKGNFSELDVTHWTDEMQKLCNYNPKSAQNHDNGVFWIDYTSLLKFFQVIYINWNPQLFPFTTCIHHTWSSKDGPIKDSYNVGDNPQYQLVLNNSGQIALWVLLTRHITEKDDFAENQQFITLIVFKGGNKIFYPLQPYKDGVRINSPHYLCKMVVNGPEKFTFVISQYKKSVTTHYTLRVFCSREFLFKKIPYPYNNQYEKKINDEWTIKNSGGFENNKINPIYQIHLDYDSMILIELKAPKQFSINIHIKSIKDQFEKDSGPYRPGFCVLQLDNLKKGIYNINLSTFRPSQGPFILTINSSCGFQLNKLQ